MATDEIERPILIGWASVNITPEKPVQMFGQFYERVSEYVRDPVTATALALDSVDETGAGDQAILVSCDLVVITKQIQDGLRVLVASRLDGFDINKLFVAATHTHSAPTMEDDMYPVPGPGVISPAEYVDFLMERLCEVVIEAWNSRKPGGVSWALGHAAVGYNRRVVYDDGTARMYGSSDTEHFWNVEGSQDHGVEMLFSWDTKGHLTGILINVACPAQVVESKQYVSADFWCAARKRLRERYSDVLHVLPLTSAAGDQSPRDLVRRGRGESDMRDESGLEEIGARIANAVDYVFPSAKDRIKTDAIFKHVVEDLVLPARKVTQEELDEARMEYDASTAQRLDERSGDAGQARRLKHRVLERYKRQAEKPVFAMELHVIRLGDIAIVTNPFELYLDYGLRIKARSKALQTFVVQLACDHGRYLPTAKAVAGGHYGARVADGNVGPEGGQALVNRTLELINRMWNEP